MQAQSGFRAGLALLLAALLVGAWPWLVTRAHASPSGVGINVTTGLDDNGSTCDSNSCTLRGAINLANNNGQTFNIISFAPSASSAFVTNGPLPAITIINGSYNSTFPRIYGANGGTFFINADYVGIVFLTIVNTSNGPDIEIDGGTNISIGHNYLGTVAGAPNCAYVSLNQGTNGVRVRYNNAGNATTPVAYIYGNVISCHQDEGIFVGGATVKIGHDSSDVVRPNLIGLTPDGLHPAGNGAAGVIVVDWIWTAQDSLIEGNVISGNVREGIRVVGTENTTIAGNIIGLTEFPLTTTTPIPNGLSGITLDGTYSATIGSGGALALADAQGFVAQAGLSSPPTNLIAGNTREGIYVHNSSYTLITPYNFIGAVLQRVGNRTTIVCTPGWGNGLDGILLDSAWQSTVTPLAVGCNGGAGIATAGFATTNPNTVLAGIVAFNGGLPIDRGDDGVKPVNYPRITSVSTNGITPTIAGTACANCLVYLYAALGNPAAPGGGGLQLGTTVANGAGQWSLTASPTITTTVPVLAPSAFTAHVIDPAGSTYEMRPRPQLFLPLIRR